MIPYHKVVISGATGAIGMALIDRLVLDGVEVLVLYRENSSRSKQLPKHPLVTTAICDLEAMDSFSLSSGIPYDVFFHFAWDGTFGDTRNDTFLQNRNIKYTLDAVRLANRLGCHTFIGAGSQAEYGRSEMALTSKTPTFPENGYGIAKLCAGQLSRILCNQLGMKHIWTRILSVYGPYDGKNTMVMSTILKISNGEFPKFTKGEQVWDFLFSKDAALALELIASRGKNNAVYPLGSGQPRTLREYIYDIRDVICPSFALRLGEIPYSPNQVMHLEADITDLQKDTGFQPKTPFKSGISQTYQWIQTQLT